MADRPALLLFLWSLWLSVAYFGFGPYSFVPVPDNGDSNLPARLHMALSLADGQFGYWSPMAGCGADRLAMGYNNKWDVPFFFLLPGWLAHGLLMWIQRFVAGYFMFRLLRDHLLLEVPPSLFGAFTYSLFSQASINHQWAGFTLYDGLTTPGLPFLLWALSRLDGSRKWRDLSCAAGLGLFSAWTGHYSYTLFLFPLMAVWFCFILPRPLSFWAIPAVYAGAWFLGELPMLWASFLNAPLSQRAAGANGLPADIDVAAPLSGVLGMVGAYIRDNSLALSAALAACISWARGNRLLSATMTSLFFCTACVMVVNLSKPLLGPFLGVAAGFQFDRFYLLIPFLSTVAGSLGFHLIPLPWRLSIERQGAPWASVSLKTALCLVAILLVIGQSFVVGKAILIDMADGNTFRNLYGDADIRAIEGTSGAAPHRTATLSTRGWQGLHPGYVWAYGLESADGYLPMYPRRYYELWQRVLAPSRNSNPDQYDYFLRRGSRMYAYIPPWTAAEGRQADLRQFCNVNLLSLLTVKYILSPVPLRDRTLRRTADGDGQARQSWASRSRRGRLLGTLLGQSPGKPLFIYENLEVLPRFFLAGKVRAFDTVTDLLDALGDADDVALRSTAYLLKSDESAPRGLDAGESPPGTVHVSSYSADRIKLAVTARTDSVLLAINSYSPYWKAYVDGWERSIFPADHAFQGVAIPRGDHEVVLSYEPPYARRSFHP
jgi:hypothetical protein